MGNRQFKHFTAFPGRLILCTHSMIVLTAHFLSCDSELAWSWALTVKRNLHGKYGRYPYVSVIDASRLGILIETITIEFCIDTQVFLIYIQVWSRHEMLIVVLPGPDRCAAYSSIFVESSRLSRPSCGEITDYYSEMRVVHTPTASSTDGRRKYFWVPS